MICIYCKHNEVKVIDSRDVEANNSIRRRRECPKCGRRFTTYETVEETPVLVIKNNGTREPYNLNKLKAGIMAACQKRPVSMKDIDNLCIEVEKKIYNTFEDEISSKKIGEFVMDGLQKLDEVSYVRFASVYKKFKDISTFFEFVNEFEKALKE
ncbi:MAG: transcriptional repressor NrdR [Clostridia bacterium]|nr:transcriptional repressor NrdR [Clostridia bacterium]